MNVKLGIAAAVVLAIGYGSLAIVQGERERGMDPEDRYIQRAQAEQAEKDALEFGPGEAYQFRVGSFSAELERMVPVAEDVHEPLRQVLNRHLAPYGVNRGNGPHAETGQLGIITLWVEVTEQRYRGHGSNDHVYWAVPSRLDIDLDVDSGDGASTWDGSHAFVLETAAPTSINDSVLTEVREDLVEKLAGQLDAGLRRLPPFSRD